MYKIIFIFNVILIIVYYSTVFGNDGKDINPTQLSIVYPENFSYIVSYCSFKSLFLNWKINTNESDNEIIIEYSVYLRAYSHYYDSTQLYDKIEIHGINKTEYQVVIPPHWCDCNVYLEVRAYNEHSYIDNDYCNFVIYAKQPGSFHPDSFAKGKIINDVTQRIVPNAQITFDANIDLTKYHGYYVIFSEEGCYELTVNDKCHDPLETSICVNQGFVFIWDLELTFNCHSIDLNSDGTIDIKDIIVAIKILSGSKQYIIANNQTPITVSLQSTVFALQYISGL